MRALILRHAIRTRRYLRAEGGRPMNARAYAGIILAALLPLAAAALLPSAPAALLLAATCRSPAKALTPSARAQPRSARLGPFRNALVGAHQVGPTRRRARCTNPASTARGDHSSGHVLASIVASASKRGRLAQVATTRSPPTKGNHGAHPAACSEKLRDLDRAGAPCYGEAQPSPAHPHTAP